MTKKSDSGTMKAASASTKKSTSSVRKAYEEACAADLKAGVAYREARATSSVSDELLSQVNEAGRTKADALQALNEAEATEAAK